VQGLAGVFFQMCAGDTDDLFRAIGQGQGQLAATDNGNLILTDLIALG